MAEQTGQQITVNYKEEVTFNTPPDPSGGEQLRITPSGGQNLARALIESEEIRKDLLTTMGRLGSSSVDGAYSGELSVQSFDTIMQAVMRSTFVAAVAITEVEMTSITTTVGSIVAAAGDWQAEGVRVGDVVRLTGHSTAANNDLNLRVISVSTLTLGIAGDPLVVDAVPDVAFTLTILKKLSAPAGVIPVRRSYHFEEYYDILDLSETFGGVRFVRFRVTGAPDGFAVVEIGVMGASATALDEGASPFFAAPTVYTSTGLIFTDASIRYGGVEKVTLTGVEILLEIAAETLPVIGSNTTPDVFDNDIRVTGNVSGLRQDLLNLARLEAETELELQILLEEPTAVPKECINFFVPRLKISASEKELGGDGALLESSPWFAGPKETVDINYDTGMVTISTSSP